MFANVIAKQGAENDLRDHAVCTASCSSASNNTGRPARMCSQDGVCAEYHLPSRSLNQGMGGRTDPRRCGRQRRPLLHTPRAWPQAWENDSSEPADENTATLRWQGSFHGGSQQTLAQYIKQAFGLDEMELMASSCVDVESISF